jgi:hypothetical protein
LAYNGRGTKSWYFEKEEARNSEEKIIEITLFIVLSKNMSISEVALSHLFFQLILTKNKLSVFL